MNWASADGTRWNLESRIRAERLFRGHIQSRRRPKGRIVRLPCVFWGGIRGKHPQPQPPDCMGEPADAHHVDYDEPFRVVWVCRNCHRKVEREKLRVTPSMVCDYTSLVANLRRVSARMRREQGCGTVDAATVVEGAADEPAEEAPF